MKVLGSTIEINRGETFTLRKTIVNSDGTPFIVKPDDLNPYMRLSVSSNIYPMEGRYKKNYWLKLSNIKRYKGYEHFPDNVVPDRIGELDEDYIWYVITEEGREYYKSAEIYDSWIPYSFVYNKEFINFDTSKLVAGIYKYELAYTCGVEMIDWLKSIYSSLYGEPRYNISTYELAHYICKKRPDLLEGVDITEPLSSYTKNNIIQKLSKLIVKEA